MNLTKELQTAIEAVRKACALCVDVQSTLITADTVVKKDRSPVTVADFGAQALISAHLETAFPSIPLVAEEDAGDLQLDHNRQALDNVIEHAKKIDSSANGSQIIDAINRGSFDGSDSGRYWVLDPIDGTKGFLRKQQYAAALALVENHQVILGVLGCPNLLYGQSAGDGAHGCIFHAARDSGAYLIALDAGQTELPVHVDEISAPSRARFCESVESAHSSQSDSARIAELVGISQPQVRMDTQCKYAALARGEASIYVRLPKGEGGVSNPERYIEKVWRHAGGMIIIEEAGGVVTDL